MPGASDARGDAAGVRPDASAACNPVLSRRLLVLRSGRHLARIAERLRAIEMLLIEAEAGAAPSPGEGRSTRRARLQAMDLSIQELTGLSGLLTAAAHGLTDAADPALEALVDLPRLQSLATALRTGADEAAPRSETLLF